MKTIKLIDIWERITKGKKPPKKILLMGTILKYDEDLKTYIDEIEREPIDRIFNLWVVFKDEVEIIEDIPKEEIQVLSRRYPPKEDKKIEKIGNDYYHNNQEEINQYLKIKINEIIDKVNGNR